jgi:hypothetical protein
MQMTYQLAGVLLAFITRRIEEWATGASLLRWIYLQLSPSALLLRYEETASTSHGVHLTVYTTISLILWN